MKYIESLRNALEFLLEEDPDVYIIGEDIAEPYGGAFKVTKGLSKKFPGRLIQTPMSEQAFTGMGIGMALNGLKAIVEIMFGDFITLVADQIINHASKFYDIYGRKLHFVLRTPSGGYRGYGPTHSQSLERLFLGIPSIKVVAPSILHDPGKLLINSVYLGCPIIFIENKLDYGRDLIIRDANGIFKSTKLYEGDFPVMHFRVKGEEPDITFITYGGMVHILISVLNELLYDYDIVGELIVPSDLTSLEFTKHISAKKVVIVEESWEEFGWASYIAFHVSKSNRSSNVEIIGARPFNIPAAKSLEEYVLPTSERIVKLALNLTYHG